MTDLSLRRQVAEALGWIVLSATYPDGEPTGMTPGNPASWLRIPAYETDIAAAWELLDRLRYDIDNTTDPSGVTVIIWMDNGEPVSASAATAPAAICKAWLKYKEQQDDRFN